MKQYKYKINGNLYNVTIKDVEDKIAHVEVNGTPYEVELDNNVVAPAMPKMSAAPVETPAVPVTPVKQEAAPAASAKGKGVKSPLPGVIKDVKVAVGDVVKVGQTVVILEAMKMENNINADKEGTVTAIKVNKGDSVLEGTDLILIG
ncbi:MAG: acetyl-CoA carboxylase biotin carboxyl carrier protein subunit [Bacteroidales bacterium]|nr:acetyl-CoA carboxylase biotin carboxyl carrier protein subunit [Bacteroidales bacterium]